MPFDLEVALLYFLARATQDSGESTHKMRTERVHAAIYAIYRDLREMGAIVTFDFSGERPYSRQVQRAIDDSTPFIVQYDNPVFPIVMTDQAATKVLGKLNSDGQLSGDWIQRLSTLYATFQEEMTANVVAA